MTPNGHFFEKMKINHRNFCKDHLNKYFYETKLFVRIYKTCISVKAKWVLARSKIFIFCFTSLLPFLWILIVRIVFSNFWTNEWNIFLVVWFSASNKRPWTLTHFLQISNLIKKYFSISKKIFDSLIKMKCLLFIRN